MYKLAVFDFDSTLMDGETLEFIAKEYNIEPLMKQITKNYTNLLKIKSNMMIL